MSRLTSVMNLPKQFTFVFVASIVFCAVGSVYADSASIAIPVAMLRAAEDAPPAAPATEMKPKHETAQALFKRWQANARTDGKIPGALIGKLGAKVKYFISVNKDDQGGLDLAVKFEMLLLPRFDTSRDWTQSDAIALLDHVSAIHSIPLETTLTAAAERTILAGEPLPAELADAAWGQPAPNGLRVAWLLEPRAKEYPLGTSLKSRILLHNSGKETVIFIMPSWQQSARHTAHDAKGVAINVSSVSWTTLAWRKTYRLAPGEYCESSTPGIGVGAETDDEDWANVRVGSWIEAKQGDEVRFSPGAVEVRFSPAVVGIRDFDEGPLNKDPKDAADLWEKLIAERVGRELPLPAAAAERVQIIRRVTLDLFGEAPTPEEIAAFIADDAPTAQAALEKRLKQRPGIAPFTGTLPPGDIQFRVLAADPDVAKRPRAATDPAKSEPAAARPAVPADDPPADVPPRVQELIAILQDPDANPSVRTEAALELARLGDRRATMPLVAALKDEDKDVRGSAAAYLGSLKDPRALGPLVLTLQDQNAWVTRMATQALGEMGNPLAVPALTMALHHPDKWVRYEAAESLGRIGTSQAAVPLIAALSDKEPKVREMAVKQLRRMNTPDAVEPLIGALADEQTSVRSKAAIALAELDESRAVGPLLAALERDVARGGPYTSGVVFALGEFRAVDAVEPLIAALDENNPFAAIGALGKLGDRRAVGPLVELLKKDDLFLQVCVAEALGRIDDRRIVSTMLARLEGDDPAHRRGALLALAYLGDARAAGPLTEILEPKNGHPWRVRNRVARALGYVDDPAVVDTLLTLFENESHWIVEASLVHGLGATEDPRVVETLIGALKHPSCSVRIEAAIGLGRIGDARAVEPLTAALDVGEVHPPDPDRIERLRKEIRRALAACGEEAGGLE